MPAETSPQRNSRPDLPLQALQNLVLAPRMWGDRGAEVKRGGEGLFQVMQMPVDLRVRCALVSTLRCVR